MIDITAETTLSLAEAAKLVPPARSGNRRHLSTLLRWITKGAKAPDGSIIRLEARRLGGRWLTSREALQRFSDSLTPQLVEAGEPVRRTPTTRRRAAKELESLGI
jgi:hypothetical protein